MSQFSSRPGRSGQHQPTTSIAYVLSTYPSPSQTFIRREIAALEAQGLTIHRFVMRPFAGELVDEADRAEQRQSTYILNMGIMGLAGAMVRDAVTRPIRWSRAMAKALSMGLASHRGMLRHVAYLAEACVLRRRLEKCNARHMHPHFGSNSAAAALLCRLLGGPSYSMTIHGPEDFDAPRQISLREKIDHAAFVVAVSQFTRAQIYRSCAFEHWGKIHVIHCGVDRCFLSAAPVPVPQRPRLVALGRLNEQKGHLLLVRAAKQLRDRGLDFEIVIIGDGPMRGEIQELINMLDLRDCLRITGYLSNHDVRRELQEARALVLPSFAEGLPVVVMEAFALGRPVIGTSVAGIPELVVPGVNGWLVPAGAVGPLVDAMAEALVADPALLDAMGREGAARVAEQHNVETEARKLATLFIDYLAMGALSSPEKHTAQFETALPGWTGTRTQSAKAS